MNLSTYYFFQPSYRLAIRTEGMIEDLVRNLKSENQELQMHCASAIFKVGATFCFGGLVEQVRTAMIYLHLINDLSTTLTGHFL